MSNENPKAYFYYAPQQKMVDLTQIESYLTTRLGTALNDWVYDQIACHIHNADSDKSQHKIVIRDERCYDDEEDYDKLPSLCTATVFPSKKHMNHVCVKLNFK